MRRVFGFVAFAFLLGGAIWLGLTATEGTEHGESFERFGLPDDVPIPFHRFHELAGVGGGRSAISFRPLERRDLTHEASELLEYFRKAMRSNGWESLDEKVAPDGAWTAGWTKDQRVVRLTFGPELLGGEVSLIVEQCPPDRRGPCNPSALHPLVDS